MNEWRDLSNLERKASPYDSHETMIKIKEFCVRVERDLTVDTNNKDHYYDIRASLFIPSLNICWYYCGNDIWGTHRPDWQDHHSGHMECCNEKTMIRWNKERELIHNWFYTSEMKDMKYYVDLLIKKNQEKIERCEELEYYLIPEIVNIIQDYESF